MLKVREKVQFTLPTPVEPALEANEANEVAVSLHRNRSVDKKIKSTERIHPRLEQQQQQQHQQASDEATPKLVRVPAGSLPPLQISPSRQINSNSNVRNKLFSVDIQRDNFECVGKADDTEQNIKNNITNVRYEIPENRLSRTATLILGNRKELEMHEFSFSKLANDPICGTNCGRRIPTMPEIDPSGERTPSE